MAAPEIQKLCSVSEWCVVVVLMINKGLLSPGKDLAVDPRSISYLRNCVWAENKIVCKNPPDEQLAHVVILILEHNEYSDKGNILNFNGSAEILDLNNKKQYSILSKAFVVNWSIGMNNYLIQSGFQF